ncbi:hypothetical protein OHB35_22025 [Streptomyces phaeochromogenes]|uniref:Uncharacterized protein n=1 Tax=Streptomyces phaeochromogenes TaxID=1923 RepID=A0ABZ1HC29_STRPH|nr:hypothetical protein [Streptomyces phaeochromogenes]WSD15710.1 hypothetical protein OHB35_22025 [Streptomyces phaeochromogenes]
MTDVRESVMPRQVRGAQLLLFGLAFAGLVVVLALSGRLTSYGLGDLMAPWILVWVCALLALKYDGSARGGVRITTIVVMVFVVVPSFSKALGAAGPAEFTDAALRIVLGLPVIVLLFLPETTAWFDRAN